MIRAKTFYVLRCKATGRYWGEGHGWACHLRDAMRFRALAAAEDFSKDLYGCGFDVQICPRSELWKLAQDGVL